VYAYVTGGLDLGFESTVSSLRAHRKAFDVGSSSDQSLTDAQKDHKTTNGGLSVISVAREPETSAAKYGLFPYPPNPNFEGREMILQQVHERIHHPRRHQYPGMVRSTALHGLGGIGKTQIALRYVYTHQGSYDAIFWVSADNETKLSKGYDDIAKVLKLKASELEDQREIVREVKHWLQQTTESWLIVFDNVEFDGTSGIEIFRNYWPASAIQGSVLVTTRNRGSVVSLGSKVLEIQPLQEGEAIKVFYANLLSPPPSPIDGDSGDHASAVKLVRELGGLPLAITQASAYINRQRSTVEAYYKKFIAVDDSLDMLSDTSDTTYELKTVTTTWNISFEQIRGSNSAVLLNVLALLDPDGVPESVFTAGGSAIDTNDRHHVFMHDEWRYEDSVGTLAQYALLSRQHKSLYTHRLVQQVSLRRMSADDVVCAYEAATRLVWKVFPASDRSSLWPHWAAAARYLSQALRLEMHYQRYRESTGTGRPATHVAELFTQCGKYLRERSLFEQSIRFLEVARDTQESRNGRMHLATASCYYALGRSYLDLMQLDKAISHFKIAAEVQTSLLGENDRTTANSLNDMGIAYHESGELDEAERLYRVRLAVYERLLGPDDPYTASSLNNLAMIALARGDWAQGVTLTRRSLAIQEHALGNDHPYLPKTRNYLAFCLRAAGELEEAAKLHQLALAYQELKLGKQHVSTATSLQGLADVYHDQGHFDDALDLYLQVFRIRRETLKVQHPDRVGASKNLIMLLCKLNRMDQAEACIADIEQEAVAELGPEHELIINALLAPGRSLILECSKDIESFKSLPLEGRYVQHQH
jgi:tetratricopeptide (TPR) repeat protein